MHESELKDISELKKIEIINSENRSYYKILEEKDLEY